MYGYGRLPGGSNNGRALKLRRRETRGADEIFFRRNGFSEVNSPKETGVKKPALVPGQKARRKKAGRLQKRFAAIFMKKV